MNTPLAWPVTCAPKSPRSAETISLIKEIPGRSRICRYETTPIKPARIPAIKIVIEAPL